MDAFEIIVGNLLEEDSYWIRHSVKINLTKEEKESIGTPKAPRPEIDIVAYNVKENKLLLVKVKSYFDSPGVKYDDVTKLNEHQEGRYKLFTSENYLKVLRNRLLLDWIQDGLIKEDTSVCLMLIAGHIYQNREKDFKNYFESKGWQFWGPTEIKKRIKQLAKKGYENNPLTLTVKILENRNSDGL
jgi:lipopolysaccharide biosynthesis protein